METQKRFLFRPQGEIGGSSGDAQMAPRNFPAPTGSSAFRELPQVEQLGKAGHILHPLGMVFMVFMVFSSAGYVLPLSQHILKGAEDFVANLGTEGSHWAEPVWDEQKRKEQNLPSPQDCHQGLFVVYLPKRKGERLLKSLKSQKSPFNSDFPQC